MNYKDDSFLENFFKYWNESGLSMRREGDVFTFDILKSNDTAAALDHEMPPVLPIVQQVIKQLAAAYYGPRSENQKVLEQCCQTAIITEEHNQTIQIMKKTSAENKGTIIYLSHGGGPLPLLEDKSHRKMVSFMKDLPSTIQTPEEILVISAHWEQTIPTITGALKHSLLYDYYGFPEESYQVEYPAQGSPDLVKTIQQLLEDKGLKPEIDSERGLDHGVFIPLKLMYPDADIPVTQISLLKGLDPQMHILLGTALQPLLKRNILVIGSGFSFHNMEQFRFDTYAPEDTLNNQFQDWLINVCVNTHRHDQILKKLENWEQAPNARYCHPREEHLLPLHVCAGLSAAPATVLFDNYIMEKRAVAFMWQ